jgi:hypothetical protein
LDDRTKTALYWQDLIYAQFRRVGIRQVGYVPHAGRSRLIERCVNDPVRVLLRSIGLRGATGLE